MAEYQSIFTGEQMDERLAAVPGKYTLPEGGIPASDMDADVQEALALAATSIQSLADYYDKVQVDAMLASVGSAYGVTAASLPTAGADTLGKVYYIGPTDGEYERYITTFDGTNYSWIDLGSTAIELTDYATEEEVSQLDQDVHGTSANYVSGEAYSRTGTIGSKSGWFRSTDYVPLAEGDTIVWNPGAVGGPDYALILYDSNKNFLDYYSSNATERTLSISKTGTAYCRASFSISNKSNAKLIINNVTAWKAQDAVPGLLERTSDLEDDVADLQEDMTALDASVGILSDNVDKVVIHHEETITKTGSLAANTGGQDVYWDDINLRPGRKYTISIVSNTSNTGYLKFRANNINNTAVDLTGNVSKDINGSAYSFVYQPEANLRRVNLYIRTIASAGSCTLTIVEEWDEILPKNSADVLVAKPNKNLADPREFRSGTVVYLNSGQDVADIQTPYGSGNSVTGYIPIKNGQTLACNVPASADAYNRAALFKEKGDIAAIEDTDVRVNTGVARTITNNLGYDAYAVFTVASTAKEVQVELGDASTFFVPFDALSGYAVDDGVDISGYGVMQTYPEELKKVATSINNSHAGTKLHFVHLSDNHGSSFGEADSFTDPSPASFLVHTGDLVADKYADSYDTTKGLILAMTKPGYVVLGNHDCYKAPSLEARYEKFIEPLNTHNGLTENTKTYYSVDFSTEKVKCIFLDMNDGYDDTNSNNMADLVAGKMSQAQINWFASELAAALTNSYDVVCFIHVSPDYVDTERDIDAFFDGNVSKGTGVTFLCQIVDAFINGTSVTFTEDGNTYTFTFASKGNFVGWMCGHTHYDCYGWLKDYPKQFSCSVARPYRNTDTHDGTYRVPKLGVTWDYVTINATTHVLSVLRMGNQETVHGTIRDAFYIKY